MQIRSFFFHIQLKSRRTRGFTYMAFRKCPYFFKHVLEQLPFFYNSSAFLLSFFFVSQNHIIWISFYLETSPLEPISLFNDLRASDYTKRKWQWRQDHFFVLNHISLIRKCFFTSAYFSPFGLKNLLNQKLSSLKTKFYFCD